MAELHLELSEHTMALLREKMAHAQSQNESAFIGSLIEDTAPLTTELGRKRALMSAYLALIEADLEKNGPSTKTIEEIIEEGEARYYQRHGKLN